VQATPLAHTKLETSAEPIDESDPMAILRAAYEEPKVIDLAAARARRGRS